MKEGQHEGGLYFFLLVSVSDLAVGTTLATRFYV